VNASVECYVPSSGMVSLDQALEAILATVAVLPDLETVALGDSLGRVLAADLVSPLDVPGFDNSAMDGYAVRAADTRAEAEVRLAVGQRIPAGTEPQALAQGHAARIFTGAPVPPGADAVVMQEACVRAGDEVLIRGAVQVGENIRHQGQNVAKSSVVIAAGHRMRAQDMGLAASLGIAEIRVRRRPRVAIFSTGDELALPGTPLTKGRIYTANNHLLHGLLQALGCEVVDHGIVRDDLDATCATLESCTADADLVISSGGASVGEEDHVKQALDRVGRIDLWRIAIRPGKPLIYGHLGETLFMGLPGNPVSSFATFLLLVRPVILALQGATELTPQRIQVRAGFEWPKAQPRREFARARLELTADGASIARLHANQSSDVLSSTVWADGLVEIPEGETVAHDDWVRYLPFSGLLG